MLPISVCIITKNEEKYIETCLKNLKKYDWEIIVTDTGSTDKTIEICEKYADQIHHFDWINDFSAARNFCISKASNDWILSVDSDMYLTNEQSVSELYSLITPCLSNKKSAGIVTIINQMPTSRSLEKSPRLFNRKYYHYEGTIHEQIHKIDKTDSSFFKTALSFYHVGYSDITTLKQKSKRNIELLEKELKTNPNDPYLYFQIGQSYYVINDMENAYNIFQKGLKLDINPQLEYAKLMVESYGHSMLALKKYQESLSFEAIYDEFCSHADFVFLMGLIYMNNALFDDAINQFLKATSISDYSVEGVNSYLAYYNIGVIYECIGYPKKAIEYYKKCGNYSAAVNGLKRLE